MTDEAFEDFEGLKDVFDDDDEDGEAEAKASAVKKPAPKKRKVPAKKAAPKKVDLEEYITIKLSQGYGEGHVDANRHFFQNGDYSVMIPFGQPARVKRKILAVIQDAVVYKHTLVGTDTDGSPKYRVDEKPRFMYQIIDE